MSSFWLNDNKKVEDRSNKGGIHKKKNKTQKGALLVF